MCRVAAYSDDSSYTLVSADERSLGVKRPVIETSMKI
jgi:hypothetical protein